MAAFLALPLIFALGIALDLGRAFQGLLIAWLKDTADRLREASMHHLATAIEKQIKIREQTERAWLQDRPSDRSPSGH